MKTDMKRGSTTPPKAHTGSLNSVHSYGMGQSSVHNLLQTAHQTIGNRAVQRMFDNRSPQREAPGTISVHGPIVQRVMEPNSFKKQTSVNFKRRSKIKSVDNALTAYHKMSEDDFAKRSSQLDVILTECDTYLGHPKAHRERISGVEELKQQVIKENGVIKLLAEAEGETGAQKFFKLCQAQDACLLVKDSVPGLEPNFDQKFAQCLMELRETSGAIEEVMKSETDQLIAILANKDTPEITKKVLNEVLSNQDEIKMEAFSPGARFTKESEKQKGVQEKYVVNHNLNAPGGSSERLGSLVHELTHVSISEQFGNTALFFAFDKNASEDEVMDLVHKRQQNLDELLATVNSGGFTQEQLTLLNMKLEYPRKDGGEGVRRYVTNFFQSKKITLQEKQRAESLIDKGMDNTIIEFDTVINQMLIYMQQWKIELDNPFYELLRTVAEEAYNHRMG